MDADPVVSWYAARDAFRCDVIRYLRARSEAHHAACRISPVDGTHGLYWMLGARMVDAPVAAFWLDFATGAIARARSTSARVAARHARDVKVVRGLYAAWAASGMVRAAAEAGSLDAARVYARAHPSPAP